MRTVLLILAFWTAVLPLRGAMGQTPPATAVAQIVPPPVASPPEVTAQMVEARKLYDDLEYDRVVPIAERVLARDDVDIQTRLDAYMLQASCLAILGDQVGAEKPFRFLLRGRPDFDLPPTTPPKILAVFRKVQVEENAIRVQTRALELERLKAAMRIEGVTPISVTGGYPVAFAYKLVDPHAVATRMIVDYRQRGEPSFSSVALQSDVASGLWRGEIPGARTENTSGIVIEYVVRASNGEGETLLQRGSAAAPERVSVSPGTVANTIPVYKQKWFWWLAGGVVAASAAAVVVIHNSATSLPDTDISGAYHVR